MPVDISNNKILVAISDPDDMSVIEDVKMSSRMGRFHRPRLGREH